MYRKIYRYLFLLAVIGLCSLSVSTSVDASTIYDNAIKRTNSLKIESTSGEVDISKDYGALLVSACGLSYYNNFASTVNNSGDWAIINYDEGSGKRIRIVWTPIANALTVQFGGSSPANSYIYLTGQMGYVQFGRSSYNNAPICDYATLPTTLSNVVLSASFFAPDEGVVANTYLVNYPLGYEGLPMPDTSVDNDADGLNSTYELTQGTSDVMKDTDIDGLNDYIESRWYTNRNSIFCGLQCAYPNPVAKDLYVEIDWMKNPSNDRIFKPSAVQLGLVKDAYLGKGILFHADTGQYGGGNELPTYIQNLNFVQNPNLFDFYDYKNGNTSSAANFNNNRHRVWHYMISGYQFADIPGSSGAAFLGDDDLFISTGHIEDDQAGFGYNSLDIAMAGTIIHELGHTICLSSQAYTGQSAGCQYSGIDSSAGTAYESVMNYDYQMFMVDYSEGLNGAPSDHNDWSAVLSGGLKDFTDMQRNDGDAAGTSSKSKKEKKIARGITSQEAKELRKQGRLGGK